MASVPYAGAPTVSPDATPPDDYERVHANPEDFGAAIGTGLSKTGQDITQVGQFWGQVQGDSVLNNALKQGDAAVENFKSLRGQDALNAQTGLNENLDSIQKTARDQLGTPTQQLDFDKQFRPYRDRYWAGQISTHSNEQAYGFANKTNQDGFEQSLVMAANSVDDPGHIEVARHKAIDWQFKQLALNGQENDPSAQAQAVQKANIGVYKTVSESMAVKNPLGAQQYAEAHKDELGPAYAPLAEQLRVRADSAIAGKAAADAWGKSATEPVHPDLGPVFTKYNQYLNSGDVQSALRLSEGLRTNAYWDKSPGHPELSHWAIGYGMHQIVRPDGSTEEVTPFTKITPQEAENNLQIQTAKAGQTAQQAVGPAWDSMNPGTRAALTSVVYNYGHVPNDIAAAATAGDQQALAKAIVAHSNDNAGVNAQRRRAEAQAVTGGFGLAGVQAQAPQQAAGPVGAGNPDVQPIPNVAPPDANAPPAPQDAAFTPTPAQKVAPTPEDMRANAIATIWQRDDLSEQQKITAQRQVEATYTAAQVAAEQDAKAKKAQKDKIYNQVDGLVLHGKYNDALQFVMNPNSGLDDQERLTLSDNIERRTGDNPIAHGPNFHEFNSRILAPAGDPNRIIDPIDIYRAENDHLITAKDGDYLRKEMGTIRKETDEYGLQIRVNSMLGYAKDKLIHEDLGPGVRINDPNGREALAKFTNTYLDQLNYWRQQGVGPDKFSLFDTKNVDALIEQIYPKRKMQQDQLRATGEANAPDLPNAPLPPPPEQVKDEKAWDGVVAQAPGKLNHAMWANKLSLLTSDPDKMIPVWNASQFGRAGYRAQDILDKLGVDYDKSAEHGYARPSAPAVTAPGPSGRPERDIPIDLSAVLPHIPDSLKHLGGAVTHMSAEERAALEKASGKKIVGP